MSENIDYQDFSECIEPEELIDVLYEYLDFIQGSMNLNSATEALQYASDGVRAVLERHAHKSLQPESCIYLDAIDEFIDNRAYDCLTERLIHDGDLIESDGCLKSSLPDKTPVGSLMAMVNEGVGIRFASVCTANTKTESVNFTTSE